MFGVSCPTVSFCAVATNGGRIFTSQDPFATSPLPVKKGKHVFRVRAIGWTGLKGPPATARFRVCHPSPLPPCMKHLPPPR